MQDLDCQERFMMAMATYNPEIDYTYLNLKDEFDTLCQVETIRDVGMSAKDCAWEVVDRLPEDEYDTAKYVTKLINGDLT